MRPSDRRQTYDELLDVIRRVRRRWRTRVALRGLTAVGATAVLALLAGGLLLAALEPSDTTVLAVRLGAGALVLVAALLFLVRPLLRRVSDEAVALYLEEHEPSLEAAVLSALEARREDAADPDGADGGGGRPSATSDALLWRTLESAIRRCHDIDDGRWVEQRSLMRVSAALAGVLVIGALAGFLGPDSARRGASLLFSTPRPAEAAGAAAVSVDPGDATVSRGADAAVSARLHNLESELVELVVRTAGDSTFDRLPMARAADGSFRYLLFDLERDTEYYVEADGVRSPAFTLTVAELPYVDRLDLELVYPAYTGLPTRVIEDGGDVTALRGTTVRVRVSPTVAVAGGGIVVDDGDPIPLVPAADADALVGEFTVRADGFYRIVLDGPAGTPVDASPRYVIDALSDGDPIVSFSEPGRDERASPIDELFVEARAEDDYGVAVLTLHYSVNGGEERTVELYGGGGNLKEVSAGHTFYLEEFSLEPGDLVSYYATAADNDAVADRKRSTSDIYFVQIQPFSREFHAAEQRQMPQGQQGQQQEQEGDLSERQRQIVAGTFNLVRDSADLATDEWREHLNTLALAQQRLREDTRTLAGRMVARQVTQDSAFELIARLLPLAADEMDLAIERLGADRPAEALPLEQRALQLLQRAEAVFREVQVTLGQNQNQGGSQSGGSPNAEDLADLFELEMDKLEDQYESVDRGAGGAGQDSVQAEVDETAQRLEELARRQQREEERRRREAMQGRGTAGGDAQRELAEQVEEEARRLERLSREQNRPELEQAARRLQDAAESMRRSASGSQSGQEARERLDDARRLLERSGTDELRRRTAEAGQRAEEMARDQERIQRESERMLESDGSERAERADALEEQKARQQEDVESLERDLRSLAEQAAPGQPDASRRLRDAANAMSETQLQEMIDFSRQLADGGAPDDYMRRLERQITESMDEIRDRLAGLDEMIDHPQTEDRSAREALEEAGELARGLESMRERARELQEQASGNPGDGRRRLDPDAARQYRSEAEQRLADARSLRQRLAQQGLDTDPMDGVFEGLEDLTREGVYTDLEELARIQTALADAAKRLELELRVRLGGEEGLRLFQSGDGAVPPEYREMVDDYYRSLSRESGTQ